MAGPGGGPPRKSHTKSRKGCKTCKRRHIRCDENFPQCRNCTKHNCRCDYMAATTPLDEPRESAKAPNLLWSPEIEHVVGAWQRTGIFPFPEMNLQSFQHFQGLSQIDLRLVHHVSSIYRDMRRKDFVQCSLWVQKLPAFLDTAVGHEFVMSSILAFSATHLAWVTDSVETKNLAYYHRGVALKGLHDAIGNFSRDNSDPVLAASILLSWQASDWGGWTSLMQGISIVVSSMSPWKETSRFASYIEDHPSYFTSNSSTISFPASYLAEDDQSLQQAIEAMQQLSTRLTQNRRTSQRLEDMLEFAQDIQTCSATMQSEQLFEKLKPLRAWLFWMPITLMQSNEIEVTDMNLLAQLYTAALSVDFSIPELGGAALGALTVGPIEQIDDKLRYSEISRSRGEIDSARMDEEMQLPRQLAARYRLQSTTTGNTSQAQLPGHQSPYGFQHLSIESQPSTPGLPGTFSNPNHSFEDLNIPRSPFLRYGSPTSSRHSQLVEGSPLPSSASFEGRQMSGFSLRGGSPAYSPRYIDDDQGFAFGEQSPGYTGGFVAPAMWT